MPVSFGFRDQENERINSILKKLMSLVFIPDNWDEQEFDKELQALSLTPADLLAISNEDLLVYLTRYNFDFENMESFADILGQLGLRPELAPLKDRALAIYSHIQQGSNAFSFGINNKINQLKQ